ncbi:GumC family protein [Marinifilum fragile]
MSDSDNFIEKMVFEEKNRIMAFRNELLSKWYWFAIFVILGVVIAYTYSYYSPSKFEAQSTILVQNESNNLHGKDFFNSERNFTLNNIQDHIGVLKSKLLTNRVIQNLNWRSSWSQKMLFYEVDLYGNEPFTVTERLNSLNPKGIPICITMLSEEEFLIRIDESETKDAILQKGRFGEPFENEYFAFTLDLKPNLIVPEGVEYCLVFNDLESLSLKLLSSLDVSLQDLSGNLIAIKMRGVHPARVVDFVNELSKVYIEYELTEKNRISSNTMRFIDTQLQDVTDSLNQTGHQFSDFQSQNKSLNLEQESKLISSDLKKLENEYSIAERKLNYYKSLNKYLNNSSHFEKVERNLQNEFEGDNGIKTMIVPSVVDITDPILNNLVLKLADLTSKREVLSYSAKENEPNMLVLEKEIRHTKQSLKENLTNLLINSERDLKSIEKRLSDQKKLIAGLPKIEKKFINIKRRYDLNNDLYNFLLKARAEAELTIASNVSNSQIIDQASLLSVKKVGPNTLLNMLIGLVLGVSLPFLFFKTSYFFNNTISSIYELEKVTKLPVLGFITHNKHKKEVLVAKRPLAEITESFRSLRTDMENLLADHTQKIISVQSVISGEGKSFVSVNLAAILAMNHRNVILVETDMRKPKLSKIFGVCGSSGMSSYLEDMENFKDIIYPTQIDNLSFIPAGPLPINPAELMTNGRFSKFIETLKSRYNYIVLDNAPVSAVTDGLLSGKYADINLFVLRHRYSRKDQVEFIDKLVEKGTVNNAKLLLNDFKYTKFSFGRKPYGKGYYSDDIHMLKRVM